MNLQGVTLKKQGSTVTVKLQSGLVFDWPCVGGLGQNMAVIAETDYTTGDVICVYPANKDFEYEATIDDGVDSEEEKVVEVEYEEIKTDVEYEEFMDEALGTNPSAGEKDFPH
jgi:hypothetical protein